MRKAGRRVAHKMRKEVSVARPAMMVLLDGIEATTARVIEHGLAMRQGETVLRQNWQTNKVEKWVLLAPRGTAEMLVSDNVADDWMHNVIRYQRRQTWEAAFVSSHRARIPS